MLIDQIRFVTRSDLISVQLDITKFLVDVSYMHEQTTSLFLIRNLDSHMVNYLNYMDNFQQVYQIKSSHMHSLNDVDTSLAQLGVFPTSEQGFSSVHYETADEKSTCDEIINFNNNSKEANSSNSPVIMACGGKDVGKSTFLRFMLNSLLNKYIIGKRIHFFI